MTVMERGDGDWRYRIVGTEMVDPEQLLAHPYNYRIHSLAQQKAMEGALDTIGWTANVKVGTATGRVVDGHMRISIAISRGEKVPVDYLDLTEEEENLAIATTDPIGAMAGVDPELYKTLVGTIDTSTLNGALTRAIDTIAAPFKGDGGEPDPVGTGGDGADAPPSGDNDQFVFGYVRWVATRVDATSDEIQELTRLYNEYLGDNGGNPAGFVDWLLNGR